MRALNRCVISVPVLWIVLCLVISTVGCENDTKVAAKQLGAAKPCLDGNKFEGPEWKCVPYDKKVAADKAAGGTGDGSKDNAVKSPATCTSKCAGLSCGDDGCGGSCGACAGQGVTCSAAGNCVACVPKCSGKICGSDGCGGTCGNCSLNAAAPHCSPGGKCVAKCIPSCTAGDCGPDGCGGVCGTCKSAESCLMKRCISSAKVGSCVGKCGGNAAGDTCSCAASCVSAGTCCPDYATACKCVPDCTGKTCGADGCGGSCGACKTGELCGSKNACVSDPCKPDPCSGKGTCDSETGACSCTVKYDGKTCDVCASGLVNYPTCGKSPCDGDPCGGKGTCNSTTGACSCKPGFTGATCGACKFEGETWPACTCSGDTCAKCDSGGCDDGNPCSKDTCDKSGKCIHISPCTYGEILLSDLSAVKGAVVATAATPVTISIVGGTTVKVWRDGGSGPISVVTPIHNVSGGALIGGPKADGGSIVGPLTLLSMVTKGDATATKKTSFTFSQTAEKLGAGKHYVVMISGLGGKDEGPLGLLSSVTLYSLGHLDVWGSTTLPWLYANTAIIGAVGGKPSALQVYALPADTTAFSLVSAGVDDGQIDTIQFSIGVVQLAASCDTKVGKCVTLGADCGDGIVGSAEGCDDGNTLPGDGCSKTCKAEVGYTCLKSAGGSQCSASCTDDEDCAGSRVFWNDLGSLGGKQVKLKVGDINAKVKISMPFNVDGATLIATAYASFVGSGVAGAPSTVTVRSYTPPKTKNGKLTSIAFDKSFHWTGSMPYLDLLTTVPWKVTLRFNFDQPASALGPDLRYIVGIAGTAGGVNEGPTTVTSSVALENFGAFDGFGTGKLPKFKDNKTIVGNVVTSGVAPDGYRFVALPANAKLVDFKISSPTADPHGYILGIARVRDRNCFQGVCVGTITTTCGNGVLGPLEACDDGNTLGGDGCSKDCAIEKNWSCVQSGKGTTCTKLNCTPVCGGKKCGSDGCGGTCGSCDDGKGCSLDVCTAAGTCASAPACDAGAVVWASVATFTKKSTPTASKPIELPLSSPTPRTVKIWHSSGGPIDPSPAIAETKDKTAKPVAPLAAALKWSGVVPFIDVATSKTAPASGSVLIDFGGALQQQAPGWRYVVAVVGLNAPVSGVESVALTSDTPLQPAGRLKILPGADVYATWNPTTKILTPPSTAVSQLQLFLVPDDATVVTLSMQQSGSQKLSDDWGLAIGVVRLGATCQGTGATAKCVQQAAVCGDGQVTNQETCDDGNKTAGDGCDASCADEAGFVCSTPIMTSSCVKQAAGGTHLCDGPACGDGSGFAPNGCRCDAACKAAGDCCAADGTLANTCSGSTCNLCQ